MRCRQIVPIAASLVSGAVFLSTPNKAECEGDSGAAEQVIDQIVVVAHKSERSIRDVAANVTVVDRAALESQLSVSIADVFRYVPGIDAEGAGTRFGTEGVTIRGIGGNRVAIVVDGVPLNDQFDVGSFSNATRTLLNTGLIQDVEVLHGPASALYGSSAIGGVVALRTPDPADLVGKAGSGGDLLATWREADDSLQATAIMALRDASKGFLAGASWQDGRRPDSAVAVARPDWQTRAAEAALLKFVADDAAGRTWRAEFIHQRASSRSDLRSILGSGRFASTTRLEGDDEQTFDLFAVATEFGEPGGLIDSGLLRAFYEIATVNQYTLDERAAASRPVSIDRFFDFEQRIHGLELNLQTEVAGQAVSHRLAFGLEYRSRRAEEYRDGVELDLTTGIASNAILGEVFPLRDFPVSDTSQAGAYLEDVISFGNWSVIATLRADRFELSPRPDPMWSEDYPFAEPVSMTESDISPKLGLIYHAGPSMDIYLQYTHGFRAPPYEDANIGLDVPAFNYRAIPNPDLRSESSDGIDVGLRWQGTRSSLRLAAFRTRYEDFIESKRRLGTDPVSGRVLFQSQNLDRTRIEGLEVGWSTRLPGRFRALSFDGSLYTANGEDEQSGQALNSVGPAQAVLGLGWTSEDGSRELALKAIVTDAWSDRDESGGALFRPPGYALLDLYAARRLSGRVTARAGILNLTDRTYWLWSEVRGLSPDDPLLPVLARPGRGLAISVNATW